MTRIFLASAGPNSWREHLADPEKHWRRQKSAFECAYSWEAAARTSRGLPNELCDLLDSNQDLMGCRAHLIIPEHRTPLPGGSRPSQSDAWVLLDTGTGWASMAVEAKAGEPFGPTVEEWLADSTDGKEKRLAFLQETLGLAGANVASLRYQLLHRTAAAVLEARKWRCSHAIMAVQAFADDLGSWADFGGFLTALGISAQNNGLTGPKALGDIKLLLGWVNGALATDAEVARLSE